MNQQNKKSKINCQKSLRQSSKVKSQLSIVKNGSVLVFTLIIMMILLTAALSIGSITVIERKTAGSTTKSNQAFQVADSAVEIFLSTLKRNEGCRTLGSINVFMASSAPYPTCVSGVISGQIQGSPDKTYRIYFYTDTEPASLPTGDCATPLSMIKKIKVIGTFSGTTRAVEAPIVANSIAVVDGGCVNANVPSGTIGSKIMTIGADGLPIILDSHGVEAGSTQWTLKCGNMECSDTRTGTPTANILNQINNYYTPRSAIVVPSDGKPIIAYIGSSYIGIIKCSQSDCSGTLDKFDLTQAPTNGGQLVSMTIGEDGNPVIAHNDASSNLRITRCSQQDCKGTVTSTIVDSAIGGNAGISVAIGADGFPIVSSMAFSHGSVRVVKCNDAVCSSPTKTDVFTYPVSAAGSTGWTTSIAVGSDSLPVIAFANLKTGENNSKILKCDQSDCAGSGNVITTIPSTTSNSYVDIAIPSDNLPVVVFGNNYIRCKSADCSQMNSIVSIGNVTGSGSSIIIGSDNLPIFVFRSSSYVLYVAKCNSLSCR